MSSTTKVVSYHSKDRAEVVFTPGSFYAEITPGKGMGDLSTPKNIPFKNFLGFYTEEEFKEMSAREQNGFEQVGS